MIEFLTDTPAKGRWADMTDTNPTTHSPESWQRSPYAAFLILWIGAVFYAILCVPAIKSRGFPAIDPVWLAFTHMWILPICVSALFDSGKFDARRYQLIFYALFTAFFGSGTIDLAIPRHVRRWWSRLCELRQ